MIEVPSPLIDGLRYGVIWAATIGPFVLSVFFMRRRWVPEALLAIFSGVLMLGSKALFVFVHYTEVSWRFVAGGPYQFDTLVNVLAFFFTQLAQPLSALLLAVLVYFILRRLRKSAGVNPISS